MWMLVLSVATVAIGVISLVIGLVLLRIGRRRRPIPVLRALHEPTAFNELSLSLCATGGGLGLTGGAILGVRAWASDLPGLLGDEKVFLIVLGMVFVAWVWSNGVALARVVR